MNPIQLNSIKGSLNLITGCASGLGKATMCWFLKNGCGQVLGIDRRFDPDFRADLKLDDETNSRLLLKTHETFDEKVEESIQDFTARYGNIDNVINVAGVALAFAMYTKNKSVYKYSHSYNLVDFNTVGTFNIIRLASKYMIGDIQDQRKTKCIVNTSCISTSSPSMGQTAYAGSKAALDSMTLCIARELSVHNIRCNTINVGYFDTELLRSSDKKVSDYIATHVALCPKKIGHPDEFAHLVQAVVENQMINGACIKIDAGAREVFF